MSVVELMSNTVAFELVEINYNAVEEIDGEYVLNYHDEFEIIAKREKEIELIFKRKVYFEPSSKFNLEVVTKVVRFADEEKKANFVKIRDDEIKEEIDNVIGVVSNYCSALVTQITASYNRIPIITPPMFLKNDKK